MKIKLLSIALVCLLGMSFNPQTSFAKDKPSPKNILDTAKDAGEFSTLLKAVETAGLAKKLGEKGPFTLFAPNDEAFKKLPKEELDALFKDKARLTRVLEDHLVQGKQISVGELTKMKWVTAMSGRRLQVSADILMIENSEVISSNLKAANGLIHVLDTPLIKAKTKTK